MPVLANPTSAAGGLPTTYLFLASLVLAALIFYFRNKKSTQMSSPGNPFLDEKSVEAQDASSSSHIQAQTQPSMNTNPQTPPNRHSLAAHPFATSPTSISPGSYFASFPEPTLSLSPLHNPDLNRSKHGHAQTYPPPFPLSDENPASFFNTEMTDEPSVFSSGSTSKSTSHSASNSTSSNSNSNSNDEGSIPRRRSYTRPVTGTANVEMTVQGEIIVAEGWCRHTRVFGGGVCKACEESSTEMERRRRLGLPVPPNMMGGEGIQS